MTLKLLPNMRFLFHSRRGCAYLGGGGAKKFAVLPFYRTAPPYGRVQLKKNPPYVCRLGGPHRFKAGVESEVAHKWARWLHNPCSLGGPHRFRAGVIIRSGPQVGKVAT